MANLVELQERRAAYVAAELKILQSGQEYGISSGPDGSTQKRGSLETIREAIAKLDLEIEKAQASASGSRSRVLYSCPDW